MINDLEVTKKVPFHFDSNFPIITDLSVLEVCTGIFEVSLIGRKTLISFGFPVIPFLLSTIPVPEHVPVTR